MASCSWARHVKNNKSIFIDDISNCEDYPKGSLFCLDPQCNTPVHPKIMGKKRRHHFCHYNEHDSKRCRGGLSNGESIEHMTAKHFVAMNNSRCCFIDHWCKSCRRNHGIRGTWNLKTEMEYRIQTSAGLRIADVMLFDDHATPIYAVEIKHTHAVEPEKTRELLESGIRVLEMDSEEVLLRKEEIAGKKFTKDSLVYQIRLVGAHHVKCIDCEMKEAVLGELREWRNHEKQYERDTTNWWEKRQIEAWEAAERIRHKRNQRRGIATGKRKIRDANNDPNFRTSQYVEGESFKCVGCEKWRLESAKNEVDFDILCPIEEFVNEHAQRITFRNREHKERCYETFQANVCDFCVMECPECDNFSTMQKLSVYGCCYKCNILGYDE